MVTAEITIVPVGTGSTSSSDFVAESERVLKKYPDINSKLTAMGTELEADNIEQLFEVLKEMHLAPFNQKTERIYTIIKIDDRRDKKASLDNKVESVMSKL